MTAPSPRSLDAASNGGEAMEPQASSIPTDEFHSDAPGARRLVIRIILPTESLQPPVRRRIGKRALLLSAGFAVLVGWVGVSMFRSEPPSTPALSAPAPNSESPAPSSTPARTEASPVRAETPREAAEPQLSSNKPGLIGSQTPEQPDAPPTPMNAVVPNVPQSALNTIRGTIRVTVRVTIDKAGAVVASIPEERGPSRYFERLAVEAAQKWAFNPHATREQRTMLLRFSFTRSGAAGQADST